MKKIGEWIPVTSGKLPENYEHVQVTYLDLSDMHTLRCNSFAFREDDVWDLLNGMRGYIIAWRKNEDIYHPKVPNGWHPATQLPKEMKDVQITFRSYYYPHEATSGFAYVCHGEWYWSASEEKLQVKVLAWKNCDDVYIPKTDPKEQYRQHQNALDLDKLNFYTELLDKGFAVERIRKHMGDDVADDMQAFCLDHGLIDKS